MPLIEAADRLGWPMEDVIAIDLPGWGESEAVLEGAGVAHAAEDAAAWGRRASRLARSLIPRSSFHPYPEISRTIEAVSGGCWEPKPTGSAFNG
mgnify:CR=1 FL=1